MVEQGADLGIDPVMEQVLELAGPVIAGCALDIENIHHQTLGQAVPAHRHARLVAPLAAQVDPASVHFDISHPSSSASP